MIKISPSLLSSSLSDLKSELIRIKDANADYAHVDCMDGHFVENIAFGPSFVSSLAKEHIIPLDVHLMIENPLKYIDAFLDGSDIITIHIETISDENFFLIEQKVHQKGKKLGISLKPNTHYKELNKYLPYIDLVLVMSVMPGFSGQKFMESSFKTIKYLYDYRKQYSLNYLIEVDGGVNESNYKALIESGVDILVSGNYLFKSNMKECIEQIKSYKKG